MTYKVIRTFEPIEKMVSRCSECPWFCRDNDGHATLNVCEHKDYGSGGYDNVLPDRYNNFPPRCPLIKLPA